MILSIPSALDEAELDARISEAGGVPDQVFVDMQFARWVMLGWVLALAFGGGLAAGLVIGGPLYHHHGLDLK